jgi:hypothetical protein
MASRKAKSKQRPNAKSQKTKKTTRTAAKKVWRIFHFENRFEMDEYRRQGGLDYVRMFVTATTRDKSNESTNFIQQLAELEHYYPEQRDAYEGRFWRLCRLTATQEDWLRGYLLDAEQKPLTTSRLAARLHISLPVMKQTLAALKRVGLIVQMPCPVFEAPDRSRKDDNKKDKDSGKGKGRCKGKSGSGGSKKQKNQAVRERSEIFPNRSESFKESESDKSNKIGIGNVKEKEILGLSSSDIKQKQQDSGQPGRIQSQGLSQERTTTSPTTSPPNLIGPTVSDEGGSANVIPFAGPPGSVDKSDLSHISHAANAIRRRCNSTAQQAGREIYKALGGQWPPDNSRQTAQDLGCFAAAFEKALESGLPPPAMSELWDSLVAEAERLRKVYRSNGGYQSAKRVWCKPVFRDKLAARLRAM